MILDLKLGDSSLRLARDGSGQFSSLVTKCPFAFHGHEVNVKGSWFQYDLIAR